jgi:CarboxypepD_reg-like domain
MLKPNYKCSQSELYSVARLGWASCQENLLSFSNFKAKYTAPFITQNLAQVTTAENLPSEQTRMAAAESERINLVLLANICLAKWQTIKRYIVDAFPVELQKANYNAAGQALYAAAAAYNWDTIENLLNTGMQYLEINNNALTFNENMPPNFVDEYTIAKTNFSTLHQSYLASVEAAQLATFNKVTANNQVCTALMSMFLDGQDIFKNNDSLKKQFVFEQVLLIISGNSVAGLKGYITKDNTTIAVPNATIFIVENEKQTITNDVGFFQILQLIGGTYTLQVTCQGYEPLIINNLEIKTGIVKSLNLKMVSIAL